MSSPHGDPNTHGTRFGEVVVTVDRQAGDCVVIAPQPGPTGPVTRSMRLHSVEEIAGAYQTQLGMAATEPVAGDIARALKFAGQQIRSNQRKTR